MSYRSIARFCFMCHYDIVYRGPDTRSANIAPKCNFTIYPALIFVRIRNHHKNFMHCCSDTCVNALYEHTEPCGTILDRDILLGPGERGGSVVECRNPEREVRGSRPTAAVLCP